MAVVSLGSGGMVIPHPFSGGAGLAFQSTTLDADTEGFAAVLRVGKAGDLAKLGFEIIGFTTAGDFDLRLETVGADGLPTGTLLGTNSNIVVTISAAGYVLGMLTTKVTVTEGQLIAAVIRAGTPGSIVVGGHYSNNAIKAGFPYALQDTTGSWVKTLEEIVNVGLEYDDGSYDAVFGVCPIVSFSNINVRSDTSPDELGFKFELPWDCEIIEAALFIDLDQDCDFVIYDSADVVKFTVALDKDVRSATFREMYVVRLTSRLTILKDSVYRCAIKPTTTTPNVNVHTFTVNTAAMMDAHDLGQKLIRTERTNAGAWTDTATGRVVGWIKVSGIDIPAGGAGGVIKQAGRGGGLVA